MSTLRIPTEEEIRAAARQGEDAVVVLVGSMAQAIVILVKKVQELEDKLAKNSNNSSKPPSSDGMGQPKRTRSLRKPSGKRKRGVVRKKVIQVVGWKWWKNRIRWNDVWLRFALTVRLR